MTERLSAAERAMLRPARHARPSPIPTQVISNGEFLPAPQSELQKKFAAQLKERADILAKKHGLPRRAFLRTASGMAAAFLAMNDVYGPIFRVTEAEAPTPNSATSTPASCPASSFLTCTRIF